MKIRSCYTFRIFEEPDCEEYGDERCFPCHVDAYSSEVYLRPYPGQRIHQKAGVRNRKKKVVVTSRYK
ncbi:hypothetical protein [Endozoicomonas sp. Mp262]|uniref:hypothetical protein n=1 Tax=Endozoicomonas sp. Mp262 TaxID=2919499 RepID=UPI0021D8B3E3